MSNIAHHDRIQVFVFALSAKDKKNVSAPANSPSIFLKHMEVRTEYYYRIHSKPSCFIASNKWDARNYRHISLTRVASHLARSDIPSITCTVARLSCSDTPTYPFDQWQGSMLATRRTYLRSLISRILKSP